jgi:hypothetical protein
MHHGCIDATRYMKHQVSVPAAVALPLLQRLQQTMLSSNPSVQQTERWTPRHVPSLAPATNIPDGSQSPVFVPPRRPQQTLACLGRPSFSGTALACPAVPCQWCSAVRLNGRARCCCCAPSGPAELEPEQPLRRWERLLSSPSADQSPATTLLHSPASFNPPAHLDPHFKPR